MPGLSALRSQPARSTAPCLAAALLALAAALAPTAAQAYAQCVPEALWQPFANQKSVARETANAFNYAVENHIVDRIAPNLDFPSWETPHQRFVLDNLLVTGTIGDGQDVSETTENGTQPTLTLASRARRNVAARGGAVDVLEPVNAETTTLRQFVRYVFSAGAGAEALAGGAGAQDGRQVNSISVVESVLNSALSSEVVDFLAENFSPVVTSEILAALAASEVGQFIMMFARESGGFKVIDRAGSASITLSSQPDQAIQPGSALESRRQTQQASRSDGMTMGEFLSLLRDLVDTYVINPLTIGAAFFAVLIWLVWRLRGSEA